MTDLQPMGGSDFARLIRGLLPEGWFPRPVAEGEVEQAPVLVGILSGIGSVFAPVWSQILAAQGQQRLATATGSTLELYAQDFLGSGFVRLAGESDGAYRLRIQASLLPALGTRASIEQALSSVAPSGWRYVEPRTASDTKGYGSLANPAVGGGYGYGAANLRYGALLAPFQGFVILSGSNALLPQETVLSAIDRVRAAGMVIWVCGDPAAQNIG